MAEYVLGHQLLGEGARLHLMSQLLDRMHRRNIESLGIGPGARTLEVGCGNGPHHCGDPSWWTQTIAFTVVHARAQRS